MRCFAISSVIGMATMMGIPASAQHPELNEHQLLAEDTCTYGEGVLESFNNDFDWCVRTIRAEWDVKPGPLYECYIGGKLCIRRSPPGLG